MRIRVSGSSITGARCCACAVVGRHDTDDAVGSAMNAAWWRLVVDSTDALFRGFHGNASAADADNSLRTVNAGCFVAPRKKSSCAVYACCSATKQLSGQKLEWNRTHWKKPALTRAHDPRGQNCISAKDALTLTFDILIPK